MQYIEINETFPFEVEKLFQYMEVHENLSNLFTPVKAKTIQTGKTDKYGVGSVRSLQIAIEPPFEESITAYKKNELIEYKITKGSPLKDHIGKIHFSSTENGSALHYTIQFGSTIPFVDVIVKFFLEKSIRNGLKKLRNSSI
ncbi:MAG: SRPBCC family protein [Sphingobacteriales bacterium]|jgi:hypothetical protein|nr:MAG: SRPBCC family protein [Sphingobacteriales bacterium]